jgi:hypothetical protein
MSGVFQNVDPPSPHRPVSVYPPPLVLGEDTLARGRGGWGSIFWKTPDTALYSTYVNTLCLYSSLYTKVCCICCMLLDGTKNNENKQKVWLVVFHERSQFFRYAVSASLRWERRRHGPNNYKDTKP